MRDFRNPVSFSSLLCRLVWPQQSKLRLQEIAHQPRNPRLDCRDLVQSAKGRRSAGDHRDLNDRSQQDYSIHNRIPSIWSRKTMIAGSIPVIRSGHSWTCISHALQNGFRLGRYATA